MTGPVQVLVVGFDEPTYSGAVLAELGRLQEAGIVRLVDLLVVSRPDETTLETVSIDSIDIETGPALPPSAGQIAAALLGHPTDADPTEAAPDGDLGWSLADAVSVGQVAAVALIEHLWAIPLRTAMQANGARALDETWLGPEDLDRLDQLLAAAPT